MSPLQVRERKNGRSNIDIAYAAVILRTPPPRGIIWYYAHAIFPCTQMHYHHPLAFSNDLLIADPSYPLHY